MKDRINIFVRLGLIVLTIWAAFYVGYLLDFGMFKNWYDIPYVASCVAVILLIAYIE